jgi:cytidylate kinase
MRVAISGKMGSGKTTLANVLEGYYGFQRFAFADKLKQVAMDLWGLSHEEVYGNKKNRRLLQDLGIKMREIDENVWADYLLRELNIRDAYASPVQVTSNVVVDDLRFKNEYHKLRENGFIVVRVEADEGVRQKRIGEAFKNTGHLSECDLDDIVDWDVIINNNTDNKEELVEAARLIYQLYR